MSLAAERRAAAERRWRERVERTARAVIHAVGRDATTQHTEAYVRETWTALDDDQVEEILARVDTMREETNGTRRLTPEEIEVVASKKTEATRAVIRELLTQDRTMSTSELWERAKARGTDLTTESSFASHASRVRKELGIDGRQEARKRQESSEPPARQPSEDAEAAQPPEEGGDEPSPTPPPAAPVAEVDDDQDDECPKGDPDCLAPNDGEWHSHEACEAADATEFTLHLPELDVSDETTPQLWITYRTGEDFGLVDRRSGNLRIVSITMPRIPTTSQWEIIKRYAELAA